MRMAGAVVMIVAGIMMLYFMTFVFGTVADQIAYTSAGVMTFGKPGWVTLAISRFNLINVAGIGVSIALIIWGFMNAIRVGDYTREY